MSKAKTCEAYDEINFPTNFEEDPFSKNPVDIHYYWPSDLYSSS